MMIKRSKKPTRKQLETLLSKYFDEHLCESGDIADVESLCIYLGVSRSELRLLEQDVRYGDLIERAKTRIAGMKKQLAFTGRIPAAVFSFDFRNNHDYTDKGEQAAPSSGIVLEGKAGDWSG